MTEREYLDFHYRLGYYEELILKRYSGSNDEDKVDKLIKKIDEWYFYSADKYEVEENILSVG